MFKRPILIVVLLALALASIGCAPAMATQSPSMDYYSGGAPAAEPAASYEMDKAAESDGATKLDRRRPASSGWSSATPTCPLPPPTRPPRSMPSRKWPRK